MSPQVWLQATAVWDALTFVLNGIVFVLIGLQLPYVMGEISGMSRIVLVEYGVGFSAVMIVVRMVWVYGETYIAYAVQRWVQKVEVEEPEPRRLFVIGWGWNARGIVARGGSVVALRAAGWADVSAEEHDHLSGLLFDRGDTGCPGADAAMAHSKAGVIGTLRHEG
jgi:NhaP-type Na+/H+ or K+/H+ antiporter